MAKKTAAAGYQDDWGIGQVGDGGLRAPLVPQEASVDGQGGTIRGKPVFTIEQVAFQLNRGDGLITLNGVTYESGAQWYGAQGPAKNDYYDLAVSKVDSDGTLNTLSFGFYETKETLPDPYIFTRASDGTNQQYVGFAVANGFSAFSAEQRAAARDAIGYWDDLINVSFIETPFQQGDINFMNTTTGPAQASAYLPYDYGATNILQDDGTFVTYAEISGDVFVATPSINPSNALFDEGQYGLTTLIHELGHSLGLEHPGAYNFGPGFDVTYENGAEYYQDSNQYSIMSYWDSEETNANHIDWELLTYRYPSTPLVHDIAAIQRIYGADMTTRTGDTVYGFNSNAGDDSFDFDATPFPIVAIWDAGGNDTLDLSGFDTPSTIDLNPGAFTSAGGFFSRSIPTLAEINARRAAAGLAPRSQETYQLYLDIAGNTYSNGLLKDNIAIAYGAVIENAVGGAGDDTIIANAVANRLDGGAGIDTASWETATRNVIVNLSNGQNGGGATGDVLIRIENLTGSKFADSLIGDSGANTINGNGGGDLLSGGAGIDTLSYENRTGAVSVNLSNNVNNQGDTIFGFENVIGGSGNDTLTGSAVANILVGGAGNDRLDGAGGDDRLNGGDGDDNLIGGSGNDRLAGEDGNDTLNGDAGDDRLTGNAGNDTLNGGSGNDRLNGGTGVDTMTGGSGRDVFEFSSSGATDTITDFRRGEDLLDFSQMDRTSAFSFRGYSPFTVNGLAQIRIGQDAGIFSVFVDANGDGTADLIVHVPTVTQLLPADFIFS